jgi:hypothetical protein
MDRQTFLDCPAVELVHWEDLLGSMSEEQAFASSPTTLWTP